MFKHVLQLLVILVMSFSYWNVFAQNDLKINYLSTYRTNVFDEGAAEIAAYDAASARLYFTNTNANTLTILDISNPATPTKFADISMAAYGGSINGVAVYNGLVAVAIGASNKTQPGKVVFFDAVGSFQREITVGVQPDMLTFTSDGKKVLTANEGEPNDDYSIDPEGSVSVIDLSNGLGGITVATINFTEFNNKKASLLNKGIRILGPNATVAQDLEPEYITLSPDNSRAYVSLQENNALAVINIVTGRVLDLLPLGYKDHLRGAPVLTQLKINELTDLPQIGTPVYNGGQPPVELGGFSGLYFDAKASDNNNYVFYTVPDRGPTEAAVVVSDVEEETLQDLRPFKLPDYQGRIVKMTLNVQAGTVNIDQQLLLSRVDAEGDTLPISGRGNIIGYDEVPVTYTDSSTIYDKPDYRSKSTGENYQELPYDPYGGDFEGIVRDTAGNFWVCDEYRPALYKFAPSGMLIERYVPQGTSELGIVPLEPGFYGAETLPRVYSKRWTSRGFEAIAYDADSSIIYAFIQSPLFNPDNSTQNSSDVVRILAVDAESGTPVAEYVYLLERNRDAGFAVSRVDKITDAVYKGDGKFLVLEGDSSSPNQSAGKKLVYEIDLKVATNILNNPIALRDMASATDKTLEQMSADELAEAGIVPVHKTKILNLPSIGYNVGNQPEGLTVLPNGALVVVNDNNFGSNGANGSDDTVLGIIRFAGDYGLDASDRDNKIDIKPQPVYGVFMPDGIATYEVNGATYIVSANGGDARAWGDFEEEVRISTLTLDTTSFPNATELIANANLGRLNVTNTLGDIDGDGNYEQLYAFGARSFSIWDAFGNLVFDSGDDLEQITAQVYPQSFNASNTDNNRDSRSDNRGPEPEALAIATIDGKPYAFIGLERIGGVMVFDISNPQVPKYVTYVNNRDFSKSVETPEAGDLGPESIVFIPKENSPSGNALMVVANDVSGSVSIFTFGDITDVDDVADNKVQWRIFPNPVRDEILTNLTSDFSVYNAVGQQLFTAKNTNRLDASRLSAGTYIIRDVKRGVSQLFIKQ